MIIQYLEPLACGNAARLILKPAAGEVRWRVLRKESGDFTGHDDPAAFLVYDGDYHSFTDSRLLVNGVTYHYAAFAKLANGEWAAPHILPCVPEANFVDVSTDAQEFVRERIDAALSTMIARGQIRISKPSIPVLSIPFYNQGTELPVVTVLFDQGGSSERALGEQVGPDVMGDGAALEYQGWFSRVTLEISLWSLNAQERNTLRRALEAAIATNLDVFGDYGLDLFEVQSVRDTEDTSSMNSPIYQTIMQVSCQVAVAVSEEFGLIEDVVVRGINMAGTDYCG